MPNINSVFNIDSEKEFRKITLDIFRYQALNNPVYKEFIFLLGRKVKEVTRIEDIPFLPISFFKTKEVTTKEKFQKIFKSSGTTGQVRSQHLVHSIDLYIHSFVKAFNKFHSNYKEFTFLALLPSYLEQGDSSLVFMANYFIANTKENGSAFYLNNTKELSERIDELETQDKKYILLGVSYALLDFMEEFPKKLSKGIVMETGGMKGRRKELTKTELHDLLSKGFGLKHINSEYGMTELLSQAYSSKDGIYHSPPWMKVLIRNTTDPFQIEEKGKKGLINIIDLANLYSCSFIATDDLGMIQPDNGFSVLGRFDTSEIRGCNLMVNS